MVVRPQVPEMMVTNDNVAKHERTTEAEEIQRDLTIKTYSCELPRNN